VCRKANLRHATLRVLNPGINAFNRALRTPHSP